MIVWRDLSDSDIAVPYVAADAVRDVIAALGRTEDIRFAPGNRRLAVAAFNRNRIAVFDIDLDSAAHGIALTGVVEFSSPALSRPHGVDFIDDDTLIVGSRDGEVALFKLPAGRPEGLSCELLPMRSIDAALLSAPGSVRVVRDGGATAEILVCNNAANTVTRHAPDGAGEVLLRKWLDVPDGVACSRDHDWIAVSNHNTRAVHIYRNGSALGPASDPSGMLRGVAYPHGLRFGADGRHLILADAGAPYIHVYAAPGRDWTGIRYPAASIRIMDDALFARGRNNPQEGGPKGLDIDAGMNLVAVTSECQPLAFFRLSAMLDEAARNEAAAEGSHRPRAQAALQMRAELEIAEQARAALGRSRDKTAKAKARYRAMKRSLSWRLTRPLRWVHTALRRLR